MTYREAFRAKPETVTMGRLLYQMRQDEAKREKALRARPLSYRPTRRDHSRVSLNRW